MAKTVDQAIDEIVAEIGQLEGQIREKKKIVNTLCVVAEREELYALDAPDEAVPSRVRPDQFYGQPLASAVRTILEMRKQQNLGAATINEIFDMLTAGGYTFNTKNDDVAKQSLRNSISKNTVTFHKLPNGRFGMLSWYPSAKPARPVQLTAVGLGGASVNGPSGLGGAGISVSAPTTEEEEETETATDE